MWYAVNERSGRDMVVLGAIVVFVALGLRVLLPQWWPELRALVVAFVLIIGLVAVTARASRHIRHFHPDQ